jgi:hypothetical protein
MMLNLSITVDDEATADETEAVLAAAARLAGTRLKTDGLLNIDENRYYDLSTPRALGCVFYRSE